MARAILFGTPVAPGIAIGKVRFTHHVGKIDERFIMPEDTEKEVSKLLTAAQDIYNELAAAKEAIPQNMEDHRAILTTHMMICQDPRLLKDTEERIRTQRMCAPWALHTTVEGLYVTFKELNDPYLRERAQDVRSVGLRILCRLAGKNYTPQEDNTPNIYVAEDLSPADTLALKTDHILALVMTEGGPTSHTAIVARSLRVPAMVGVTGLLETVREGDLIIVNALHGRIYVTPDEAELASYAEKQDEYLLWEKKVAHSAFLPAETTDGVRIDVQANMEHGDTIHNIHKSGAEGVGLYRTEYAFLHSRHLPTEEDLYTEYVHVTKALAPQRVVFRTLDVGADKILQSHMALKESNPALGLRGIRFCLRHQNLFRTQIKALLRAAVHGNMALMLPMITSLEEVRSVRRIIQETAQELQADNISHTAHIPLGIMVEVPSTILIADALARECDFFSIGTNDLIHYLLAIDRTNKHVGYVHEPLHPAVTRSIKLIIDCAHREGIGISVCGELAADPYYLAVLVGMGVDAVSAAPQSIPLIKHLIRSLNANQCIEMVHTVLATPDIATAKRMVAHALTDQLHDTIIFHSTMCTTTDKP